MYKISLSSDFAQKSLTVIFSVYLIWTYSKKKYCGAFHKRFILKLRYRALCLCLGLFALKYALNWSQRTTLISMSGLRIRKNIWTGDLRELSNEIPRPDQAIDYQASRRVLKDDWYSIHWRIIFTKKKLLRIQNNTCLFFIKKY